MLKGAQKKMIVVKTGDSKFFEEAYFVVRNDALCSGGDMVGEANKIIDSCGAKKERKIKNLFYCHLIKHDYPTLSLGCYIEVNFI